MTAYCFFDVREVTDPEKLARYRERVLDNVAGHGGRYIILGGAVEVMEGDWAPGIPVIIEFPSLAAAHRWYASNDYAPLKALRLEGANCSAIFIEGCDETIGAADG